MKLIDNSYSIGTMLWYWYNDKINWIMIVTQDTCTKCTCKQTVNIKVL